MEIANYSLSTLAGALVLVGFVVWVFWINKKHPELSFGEIINFYFLQEKVSGLMLALFAICIAEAAWAASIHPKGQVEINVWSRLLVHGSITLVSIICGIYFPAGLRRILSLGTPWKQRIPHLLTTFVFLIVSLLLPLWNTMLIAGGLGELKQFMYVITGRFFVGFSHMSYAMMATTITWFSHYILVFLDAMIIFSSEDKDLRYATYKGISDVHKTITKKGEREKEQREHEKEKSDGVIKGVISWLLNRYDIRGADLAKWIQSATEAKDKMSATNQARVAENLISLQEEIKELDLEKKTSTEERKAEIKKEIKDKIYEMFKASTSNGEGLGLRLPKK